MTTAVFPGSFDPITNGHLDLIKRVSLLFDRLIVLVSNNLSKKYLFSLSERLKLVNENLQSLNNVKACAANELTVNFMKKIHSNVLVRGIRNGIDLDYERSIAVINHHLNPHIQTIFLLSNPRYEPISSKILKETFHFGGDISGYVPRNVSQAFARIRDRS